MPVTPTGCSPSAGPSACSAASPSTRTTAQAANCLEPLERSPTCSADVEECPLRTMVQQPRVAPGTQVVAAAWQWSGAGVAMLATTAVFVAMAVYVWRRRGGSAGAALALVLVALLLWAGTYAAELGATDLAAKERWGDVKYVGLVLLPPAWFAFAALFAGRGSWVNGRNLALLAIHPLVVLLLLANAATHDLIRWYPPEAALDPDAVAEPGPLFWPHLVYSGVVIWGSLILMVAALVRASRVYRRGTPLPILRPGVAPGGQPLFQLYL